MSLPEQDPDKKTPDKNAPMATPPIVDPKKAPTQKINVVEATPTGRLTSQKERDTTDQDPIANKPTEFNLDKGTSEQDKTLADIATQMSLAQSSFLQEEDEIKKGNKRREILESGKIFQGKYEIIKMIGSGGMGQVYVANHTALGNKLAIKVLNTNFIGDDDDESIDRFKREARATAAIDHPNAVKVFDFGAENDICYLVMEYLNGETLRKRLSKQGRFSILEVSNLVEQVCSVLEVMHRKGIVHRDLKPDNIFFHKQEDREVVKVLDFGIAKVSGSTLSDGKLTGTGALLGTPHYMSPEQCQGMKIDNRSDLYSFGIIVYELLSGTLPFEAENTLSMLFKHVRDNPLDIRNAVPDLPEAIVNIVMKLLEKHPKNRYQSAKEVAEVFSEAVKAIPEASNTTKNSTPLEKGKTSDLDIRTTIETAMLPGMKRAEALDEPLEEENNKNKPYEVQTQKNQQASVTRPVGRVVDNFLEQKDSSLMQSQTDKASPNNPLQIPKVNKDGSNGEILNRDSSNGEVSKNSQFIKYAIPIAIVVLITTLGVWKMMSDSAINPTNSPSPTSSLTKSSTEKEILLKENFVLIPKAKTTIGTNGKKCDYVPDCQVQDFEKPAHEVVLSSYYISKYEVTNEDYYKFTKESNYVTPLGWDKETKSFLDGTAKLPVNQISWEDVQAYCKWRSEKEKFDFRLPTEAEWEHAARGNTDALFPWGDDWDSSFVYGAKPADRIKNPSSIEVPPNNSSDRSPFGIFAMAGNVAEWTSSKFEAYPNSIYEKKVTEKDRECIVVKGGSFNAAPTDLRVTSRAWYEKTKKDSNIGFRLAVTAKESNLENEQK